jgi:hypothetical protein
MNVRALVPQTWITRQKPNQNVRFQHNAASTGKHPSHWKRADEQD